MLGKGMDLAGAARRGSGVDTASPGRSLASRFLVGAMTGDGIGMAPPGIVLTRFAWIDPAAAVPGCAPPKGRYCQAQVTTPAAKPPCSRSERAKPQPVRSVR